MADPLVGRLSQVLFDLVLFPLGILNLLWMAPVLAIWRRVWFTLKPTRQVRGKVVVITGASSGIGKVSCRPTNCPYFTSVISTL
jgi:hypothetical protein